jgi:hypothetical protein
MRITKTSISPPVRGRPGARWTVPAYFWGKQFPAPCQQSLGRDNGGDLISAFGPNPLAIAASLRH